MQLKSGLKLKDPTYEIGTGGSVYIQDNAHGSTSENSARRRLTHDSHPIRRLGVDMKSRHRTRLLLMSICLMSMRLHTRSVKAIIKLKVLQSGTRELEIQESSRLLQEKKEECMQILRWYHLDLLEAYMASQYPNSEPAKLTQMLESDNTEDEQVKVPQKTTKRNDKDIRISAQRTNCGDKSRMGETDIDCGGTKVPSKVRN